MTGPRSRKGRYSLTVVMAIAGGLQNVPAIAETNLPTRQFPAVTLIAGFAPGGGEGQGRSTRRRGDLKLRAQPTLDLAARFYARHIGHFLPGRPQVTLRHMPGGGGLLAAGWLYSTKRKDGSALGLLPAHALKTLFLKRGAKRLDPARFLPVGGSAVGEYICAARTGANGFGARGTATPIFGATAPRERSFVHAKALAANQLPKLSIVSGYANIPQIALAWRRGEINGFCGLSVAAIKSQLGDQMANGTLVPLWRFAPPGEGSLPQVMRASQSASDATMRQALEFIEWQGVLDQALFAPPGTLTSKISQLNNAFKSMLQDPEVIGEAVRWGLQFHHVPADKMARALKIMSRLPPASAAHIRRWSAPRRSGKPN